MGKVGIVCDSTCDLAPEELERLGVRMVPLKVLFSEETFLDWTEIEPSAFYDKLKVAATLPKTSQPSPAEFTEAYKALADDGCDEIVSIHLTSALSGTYQSAMMAAEHAPVPVHVIDTKLVTQAVGLIVKEAVAARDGGADASAVAARARALTDSTRIFFVLDTLEYLVKGGRAGKAQGLAASLLNIKPILTFNSDGIIEPFKKVKGRKKAFAELAAHVAEESRTKGRLKLSILHACSERTAGELRAEIEASGADVEIESTGLVGAVIGTYAGPEAAGCAYFPIG